jgi:hypothetical protein
LDREVDIKKKLSLTLTELRVAPSNTTPQTLSCRGTEYVKKYVGWTGRGKDGEFVHPPPLFFRNAGDPWED